VTDLDDRTCHVCNGERPAMNSCAACVGRGVIDWIGFCDTA
jgi:DnaJ-class molecular chaperone